MAPSCKGDGKERLSLGCHIPSENSRDCITKRKNGYRRQLQILPPKVKCKYKGKGKGMYLVDPSMEIGTREFYYSVYPSSSQSLINFTFSSKKNVSCILFVFYFTKLLCCGYKSDFTC